MKRKTAGTVLIVLGLVLILGAAGLVGYNLWEDDQAGKASRESLEKLVEHIPQVTEAPEAAEGETLPLWMTDGDFPLFEAFPYMDMPEQEVDGRLYIGVLEIPSLELELPIISQWSYDDSLRAPCRYTGSAYMDDLVIAGHNYGNHFRDLANLSIGDEIHFTDVDGNRFDYVMVDIEILWPDQVEQMCTGDWDLTLFTCTVGGGERIAIRCEKTNPDA